MSLPGPANRNVEIKARAANWPVQRALAANLADAVERLEQVDTFFDVPRGLLKLRVFGDGAGELIQYERPRAAQPKTSNYRILPVLDPVIMHKILAAAMGERCVVAKRRTVYHCGVTRVHFDEVAGLGRFIELEVVLARGQHEAEGRAIAERLMAKLNIQTADLVVGAYADLLACEKHHEDETAGAAQALPQSDSGGHAPDP